MKEKIFIIIGCFCMSLVGSQLEPEGQNVMIEILQKINEIKTIVDKQNNDYKNFEQGILSKFKNFEKHVNKSFYGFDNEFQEYKESTDKQLQELYHHSKNDNKCMRNAFKKITTLREDLQRQITNTERDLGYVYVSLHQRMSYIENDYKNLENRIETLLNKLTKK